LTAPARTYVWDAVSGSREFFRAPLHAGRSQIRKGALVAGEQIDGCAVMADSGSGDRLLSVVYSCLLVLAVGGSCLFFALGEAGGGGAHVWVLAPVALLLWPRLEDGRIFALQRVLGLYLCFLPLNAAAESRFVLDIGQGRLAFPAGAGVAFLLLAAFCADYFRPRRPWSSGEGGVVDGVLPWAAALLVLLVHAVFLSVLLGRAYGYGYRRSWALLGKVALFVLAWAALRGCWSRSGLRRAVGVILCATYALAPS